MVHRYDAFLGELWLEITMTTCPEVLVCLVVAGGCVGILAAGRPGKVTPDIFKLFLHA